MYPTMAMQANCDNLALKPHFVDGGLRFDRAEFVAVRTIEQGPDGGRVFKVDVTDTAAALGASGEIVWKGHFDRWSIGPGGELIVTVEDGQYVAKDTAGNVVEPD